MRTDKRSKRTAIIVAAALVAAAALIFGVKFMSKGKTGPRPAPTAADTAKTVPVPAPPPAVIDYDRLQKNQPLSEMMRRRKEDLGIEKGVDLIAKSGESLKIGGSTVAMQDVLDKIRLTEGEIVEKDMAAAPAAGPPAAEEIYGIYVVRPGDNIWNIHFVFLREYFAHRGIDLAPAADEPVSGGKSSGVGRLLKFSEKMVYIYNIRQRKIDVNLDLIHPLSKIVVFRMKQVFTLLDQIDYRHVNRIQFDGDTLWLPAGQ